MTSNSKIIDSYHNCPLNGCSFRIDTEKLRNAAPKSPTMTDLWAVVIFKGDTQQVLNWILWHIMVGYQHFLVFDNNDDHSESRPCLSDLIDAGWITYDSDHSGRLQQIKIYNFALQIAKKNNVTWLAIHDDDEFLIPVGQIPVGGQGQGQGQEGQLPNDNSTSTSTSRTPIASSSFLKTLQDLNEKEDEDATLDPMGTLALGFIALTSQEILPASHTDLLPSPLNPAAVSLLHKAPPAVYDVPAVSLPAPTNQTKNLIKSIVRVKHIDHVMHVHYPFKMTKKICMTGNVKTDVRTDSVSVRSVRPVSGSGPPVFGNKTNITQTNITQTNKTQTNITPILGHDS
jgi:hypothetical protein